MAFRSILVENEVFIKLKLDNLILEKASGEIWIPLKDISMVVIDNLQVKITGRIMASFAKYGIVIIFCDQEHLPIGMYSAYDNHSRISKTIGYQISQTDEDYSYIWKEIVEKKIINQRKVLCNLNKSIEVIDSINEFIVEIQPGDTTNREAHAAKIYFNELMGTTFSRGNDDILLNSGLDYGYAIIRAYIARTCVAYGLNTQLGIHHHNEYNRFNLVDDLIEPFRPIIDIYAYRLLDGEKYFKSEHRRNLVNILNHVLKYQNQEMYISNVINSYVAQYAAKLIDKSKKIEFPDVDKYIGERDAI